MDKPIEKKTMDELIDDLEGLLKPSPVFNLNKVVADFHEITKISMKILNQKDYKNIK